MKRFCHPYYLILGFCFITLYGHAQNVGINATGAAPTASAGLDVDFTNKGVLVPRVALTATNSASPVASPATSLLVYNTATAGSGATAVTPGYYYWSGSAWVRFSTGGDDWKILGNANTTSGTNFLGTTNAQALDFRTNNTLRFRIANGDQVQANANGTATAPFYSWVANTGMGFWRAGANILATSTAGVERMRVMSTGTILINDPSQTWDYGKLSVFGDFNSSIAKGGIAPLTSVNANQIGTGAAFGNGGNLGVLPALGSGLSSVGYNIGVFTTTDSPYAVTGVLIQDIINAQWNVGEWTGSAYRKIIGPGSVNTVVKDINDKNVLLSAPEAPENLFMDFGIGKLQNGKTYIEIDPNFTKNIIVNDKYPLKVYIQVEGQCNGVYVSNKSANGFDVIELNNGTSNISFSYSIVAQRGNEIYKDEDGNIIREANYQERWPNAPAIQKVERFKRDDK